MPTVTLPRYGELERHSSPYGDYVLIPNSSGGRSRMCPEMVWAVVVAYWLAGLPEKLVWTQGGLNSGAVAASAAVHDGLCVADLRTTNMTPDEVWRVATWLLRCGVIANIRGVVDNMVEHFHCVMANPRHGHETAKAQVREYLAGGDGLIGDWPFYGPKVPFTTWEDSPYHGLDDFDMAEPKDVWTVALENGQAGRVLSSIAARANQIPTADQVAAALLGRRIGTAALNGWTVGHLIDWMARSTREQGHALTKVATMLGQISAGQEIAQADLDDVQATLAKLTNPGEEPTPEPVEPTEPQP